METGTMVSICAMIIALLGLLLNGRKESRSDAASMAEIKTGLNTVNAGVNDIRVELRTMRESLTEHSERLARVEAKAEANSHRLDVIEGKKG
jgi:cytosine/adenosine deaminase-related metal-dependent hydrolase